MKKSSRCFFLSYFLHNSSQQYVQTALRGVVLAGLPGGTGGAVGFQAQALVGRSAFTTMFREHDPWD